MCKRDQSEQNGNLEELLLVCASVHPSRQGGMPGFRLAHLRAGAWFSERTGISGLGRCATYYSLDLGHFPYICVPPFPYLQGGDDDTVFTVAMGIEARVLIKLVSQWGLSTDVGLLPNITPERVLQGVCSGSCQALFTTRRVLPTQHK